MKKKAFLAALLCTMAFSCSESNSDTYTAPVTTGVLVKKIACDYVDEDFSYEVTYTYNGNQVIKGVYADGSEDRFFYTGNQITKIEYYSDGELYATETFSYNASGMLIEEKYNEDVFEERSTFVSTSANTIQETYYSGTPGTTTPDWTGTITITDGEISKIVHDGGNTYTYTYDTKNSPFKNVTGYGAIAYASTGDHEVLGVSHNILSIHDDTQNSNYTVNTYTYNALDFPVTATSTAIFDATVPGDVSHLNIQYFYE